MVRNFYSRKQAEIVSGADNFSTLITAHPTDYGLVASQATAFGALNTSLQAAWSTATTPETRTQVSIEAKNVAIANMRRQAIALAKVITATASVTDAQLIALGLLPRTSPTPVPPEMSAPELTVVSVTNRLVKVRVRQPGVEGNARPNGSVGAQIFTYVGNSAPTDPNEYRFEGIATRSTAEILFSNDVPSGATVFLAAAWVSRRGQRGYACTPVSVTIQGGPVLAAEVA